MEQALAAYDKALEFDPKDEDAQRLWILIFEKQKNMKIC